MLNWKVYVTKSSLLRNLLYLLVISEDSLPILYYIVLNVTCLLVNLCIHIQYIYIYIYVYIYKIYKNRYSLITRKFKYN